MGDQVTARRFSWVEWFGGLLLALFVGPIANVIFAAILISDTDIAHPFLFVIPGLLFLLPAFLLGRRARGFSIGLLTGGCIVTLVVGRLCWEMSAPS